jgi:class 3 adenylate cyclase
MPVVQTIFSAEELAAEARVAPERLGWLVSTGILRSKHGAFVFGDVFRAKLMSALLDAGLSEALLERAVAEGWLDLDHMDSYLPLEPGPRSSRTFGDFEASLGPDAPVLDAVYEVLGLPPPDPDLAIHAEEEAIFERFLEGWRLSHDDDTVLRAARLFAEGTRLAAIGWAELFAERIGRRAQERFRTGEVDRFPPEVVLAVETLVRVSPEMFRWLSQRYLEQQFIANIVEGVERFLAARGLAAIPKAESPVIVFVDLSGFTRLTEAAGDEAAVRAAITLQRSAEAVATRREGRLVKLLGDGAMLRFSDARSGLDAALDLVATAEPGGSLAAHAGVHTGRVVERDLDVFGGTVNLASRIASAAVGGEVLTSSAVVESVKGPSIRFERVDERPLKGISESVPLFRVTRNG